jgi:8-oxo-dGTP diphosphatase
MSKIVQTVAVLVFKENKVLLVKHTEKASHLTGIYGLPGGRIDKAETEKEAALRELIEETGLSAKKDCMIDYQDNIYLATLKRKHNQIMNCSWHVFICRKFSGEIKSSDETIPEWVDIMKLDNYNLLANTKQAVEDGIKFLNNE